MFAIIASFINGKAKLIQLLVAKCNGKTFLHPAEMQE
jgi:hypothetical protein